jgi:DNA-binding transcriptional LysR family regulator
MAVTLEQARALDALARHGTLARAGAALGKGHGALVYALARLEAEANLVLLDRSGYRVRLTSAGERVLVACRRMLAAADEVVAECHAIRTGWEPSLRVVFDGIFPSAAILEQVRALAEGGASTKVEVVAEFLAGVEDGFLARAADLMISVLPPRETTLVGTKLPPIAIWLVVRRDHPLARARSVDEEALAKHALLAVRGSDPRLKLPTSGLPISVHLNDFHGKREAILAGMGYGWLPEYLVRADLRRGALKTVAFTRGHRHELHPHAYRRPGDAPGRAAKLVLEGLRGPGKFRGKRSSSP